jgi:diguanylate cyclase (GGDEF)-like protein/PAS domain S-box-containing protein
VKPTPDRLPPTPPPPPLAPSANWASWRAIVQVYAAPDEDCAGIRARLVQWVTALSPWLLGFNLFIGLVLAASLAAPVPAWLRAAWSLVLAGLSARGMKAWWRQRGHAPRQARPALVGRAVAQAAVLATAWALVPWAVAGGADAGMREIVGGNMTAVIAAGAFGLCPIAPAALVYVAIIGLSSVAVVIHAGGPMATAGAVMMGSFTVMAMAAIGVGASRAIGTLRGERDADRQRHLIGLLFTDFESQSGDVLFETDGRGRFVRMSPRLQSLMGLDGEDPCAHTLLGWFAAHAQDEAARGALEQLRRAFDAGQAFRQCELAVRFGGMTRWWAITARPLANEPGCARGWRGVITDITSERTAQARAQAQSRVDALTGLANGVRLRECLQSAIEAGLSRPATLLCLNMDHFRRVNDMFGHGTGDWLLRATAQRLRQLVREQDLVARTGGDEFALLLDGLGDEAAARRFGRRVVAELGRSFPSSAGAIVAGASAGIVLLPSHGGSVDELLAHAGLALEAAKAGGRGHCEIFRADMAERQQRRLALERDLAQAVERGQLRLHWQPKVDVSDWRVAGCEALVRWEHPSLGLVPPMQFIPVAEETGLVVEVGRWVLNEACRIGAQHLDGLSIAVNASAVQVVREDFVDVVRDALAASGLAPDRLEIEITESLFIDAAPQALHNLESLRRLGVRVALDDFGTGYSSLAYLRRFPFDSLKIDRSFVRELATQRDARAIVRGIVDLATALGMVTVAEGVEDAEQLELLRRAGCSSVQGYLIAAPMALEPLLAMLASWVRERPMVRLAADMAFSVVDDLEAACDEALDRRGPNDLLH